MMLFEFYPNKNNSKSLYARPGFSQRVFLQPEHLVKRPQLAAIRTTESSGFTFMLGVSCGFTRVGIQKPNRAQNTSNGHGSSKQQQDGPSIYPFCTAFSQLFKVAEEVSARHVVPDTKRAVVSRYITVAKDFQGLSNLSPAAKLATSIANVIDNQY